jgi:hypothetical protein
MNSHRRNAASTLLAVTLLVACDAQDAESQRVSQMMVGTWAQVVSRPPNNEPQIRQVIQRRADGSFTSTFSPPDPTRKSCKGQWKITDLGKVYRYHYVSTECFHVRAALRKPMIEEQLFVLGVEQQKVVLGNEPNSPYPQTQLRISGELESSNETRAAQNGA